MNKTIEPSTRNKNKLFLIKQKEIAMNHIAFKLHFKAHLDNISIPSLTTLFGRNTAKQISILTTNQLAYTNCTRMEYISLLATTIQAKELAIGSAHLGNKIIAEDNQSTTSIDIRVNGDQYFPFGSRKSGN